MFHFLKFFNHTTQKTLVIKRNNIIFNIFFLKSFKIKKINYFKLNFFFKKNQRYYYNFQFNRFPAYSFSNHYKFKFFEQQKILKNSEKYQMIFALKFLYNIYTNFLYSIKNIDLLIFFFTLNFVFFNSLKIIVSFMLSYDMLYESKMFFNYTNTYYNQRYGKKMNSLKRRRKKIILKQINFLKIEANNVEQKKII